MGSLSPFQIAMRHLDQIAFDRTTSTIYKSTTKSRIVKVAKTNTFCYIY